jgi:hypothetical protein
MHRAITPQHRGGPDARSLGHRGRLSLHDRLCLGARTDQRQKGCSPIGRKKRRRRRGTGDANGARSSSWYGIRPATPRRNSFACKGAPLAKGGAFFLNGGLAPCRHRAISRDNLLRRNRDRLAQERWVQSTHNFLRLISYALHSLNSFWTDGEAVHECCAHRNSPLIVACPHSSLEIPQGDQMQPSELKQEEKDMVWRYAHCAGLWRRKQGRNFASLENDLRAGYEVVADGITVAS